MKTPSDKTKVEASKVEGLRMAMFWLREDNQMT